MKQPRFSVITVARNNLAGIQETQASVDAQTFTDYEWLVIDGASTDGTPEYLRSLNHSSRTWVSEPDKGHFDAMNKGIDRASGDYLIFMNSGDRFAGKDVLALVDGQLRQSGHDADFVFGDAYEETLEGSLLLKPARAPGLIKRGMFTHHQAMFYSRKAIGDVRYDHRFPLAADYHFTCRLLAGSATSLRVGFPVCVFKRGGLSETNAEKGRRENLVIQKEVLGLGPLRRAYNYVSVLAFGLFRAHFRGFYDRLRYRRVAQIT